MLTFIDEFLKTELELDRNTDLQIQRAHHSLGPKPQDEKVSILVNFQRYDTKDKILKTAWAKKITYEGRVIPIAHDLPTEVNNKLKEYKGKRKLSKRNNATEAAEDMRKRGYSLDPTQPAETDWEKRLTQGARWSGGDGGRSSAHSERIRDRLRSYQ
ncbi:hypothetical protein SKAU_G00384860 [Synaphobranchus kaupii]|uniref:Uncharacterized protein n=1 Tax=Synaphobranchus kaupii TaxID=118154 RepID=A0A9Q1EEE7_SYNKA|nr:hypothetical protein SKAU_G00384860 [Synaphobranchus kaupii]